ncbi:hypothetical protein AMS58_12295 [Pseudoalteromonas porphyrae]|uniref:Uncharacterized protein n=2 Tax=Pseudoalteromonas TaxID=53246 RepID=A0A0N0M0W8_9GAMM|nr:MULTISPECIES: hypothetical protein [Pseudoalteromonas]KPH64541.1 hypothetical protein ADS77_04450 [Pseudoalteromonas porphyrae]KPH94307.1 hypothetical protein AMS58_12295 [Pseudoalteromonas porphyrae]NNG45398.1 hypothetical protein [Pseudoalteromonas sp. NEC-BIFX-2020_002]
MKDKKSVDAQEQFSTEEQRQIYYRACIAEFQQLGYQDQYLEQLNDELVHLLGVSKDPNKL